MEDESLSQINTQHKTQNTKLRTHNAKSINSHDFLFSKMSIDPFDFIFKAVKDGDENLLADLLGCP